jgi:hypothetical protein
LRKIIVIGGAALLLLLGLAGGWYYASPGWTLKQMAEAAKANDDARFSSFVDYPKLKTDLQQELTAYIDTQMKEAKGPEAKMMGALARAMAPQAAERLASPKGMKAALGAMASAAKGAEGKETPEPKITRHGLGSFNVGSDKAPGVEFVFERRGFGWVLSGLDLDPSATPAPPAG